MSDRRSQLLLAGAVALAIYAVFFAGGYAHDVLARAGIYAIAAIGYQLVFGRLGALSLAQGCFFGLGAYAAALTALKLDFGFPLTLLAGTALPVLLAAVIAVPVLRLSSHYFALATLGIAQLAVLAATNWTDVTGGANGLYGVPPLAFGGMQIEFGLPLTLLVWTCVGIVLLFSRRLTAGRNGLRVETLREAPKAAAALGIDGTAIRFRFFLVSAAFGGFAGALQAHAVGVVSPDVLSFHILVLLLAMTVIGGRDSPLGAVLGALLLVHLPEWFRDFADYYLVAYGAALLAAIIFLPRGLAGLLPSSNRSALPVPATAVPARRNGDTLSVEMLSKRFGGIDALKDVSLTVAPGEIVGLIGPNGSGKTTLVNVVTGMEKPDSGRVRFGHADLTGLPPEHIARAGIARTFQHPQIAPDLTVRESLDAVGDGDAETLLALVGLESGAETRSGALPPAGQKRLEIARALAAGASLLALDEPAAGLSDPERAQLASLLKKLAADGHAILLIDHAMDFLLPLADRVLCLSAGRVAAEGAPDEVARDRHAVEAYFGESPL
ncbi:ATP-binding cassette domain-containing protein [Nisaea acidiphila]|uniref:ATP-binding cassette domain-containing protein n=1 Tax=Nisaea acidiphila TaxID=1862145 RepID=A0A9J7AZA2_9PROT|nr:ATP-binding cassette domain-containing protein [Nisaea acidiphila]UUX50773.1 ATP-binding cassette domain-containing protein [Nisaea acidiphila]